MSTAIVPTKVDTEAKATWGLVEVQELMVEATTRGAGAKSLSTGFPLTGKSG